jgi:hypothetical protein
MPQVRKVVKDGETLKIVVSKMFPPLIDTIRVTNVIPTHDP